MEIRISSLMNIRAFKEFKMTDYYRINRRCISDFYSMSVFLCGILNVIRNIGNEDIRWTEIVLLVDAVELIRHLIHVLGCAKMLDVIALTSVIFDENIVFAKSIY